MANKKCSCHYTRKQILLLIQMAGWDDKNSFVAFINNYSRKRYYYRDLIMYFGIEHISKFFFHIKYEDLPLYINEPLYNSTDPDIQETIKTPAWRISELRRFIMMIINWRLKIGK